MTRTITKCHEFSDALVEILLANGEQAYNGIQPHEIGDVITDKDIQRGAVWFIYGPEQGFDDYETFDVKHEVDGRMAWTTYRATTSGLVHQQDDGSKAVRYVIDNVDTWWD